MSEAGGPQRQGPLMMIVWEGKNLAVYRVRRGGETQVGDVVRFAGKCSVQPDQRQG
jgi:hypothetical protein